MRKSVLIPLAVVLLVAGLFALDWVRDAGLLRSVEPRFPGACRAVPGVPGPEDITFDPESGYAYVSSQHRRAAVEGRPVPGAIYRYRPGDPGSLLNLTPEAGVDFRPHGISLVTGPGGRKRLFVVNHPGGNLFDRRKDWPADEPRHTVEVFDLAGDRLVHVATHADPSMHHPNDIAAVDFRRFYVTNDHGSEPGLRRTIEDWLRMPWADVVYFDGVDYTIAADGLSYANGINLSPDRNTVYVAETTHNRLRIYDRDAATGALAERERIDLAFGVDNIEVDPENGDLWLAGHPKLLDFLRHARDAGAPSPSMASVLRFDPRLNHQLLYADPGAMLSGASVASPAGDYVLIGAVFAPHFVECRPGH